MDDQVSQFNENAQTIGVLVDLLVSRSLVISRQSYSVSQIDDRATELQRANEIFYLNKESTRSTAVFFKRFSSASSSKLP